MQIEIKSCLYDILNAINEIDTFFVDTKFTFEIYRRDIRIKRAVERNIEIIGEAMNRILTLDDSFQLSNARKIVDTRNRIFVDMILFLMTFYGVLL